jgi:hypothetical protein
MAYSAGGMMYFNLMTENNLFSVHFVGHLLAGETLEK